jgi:parallel beta-helix repeat protein
MPKSNQVILGEPGTILDGENAVADGVGRAFANYITIRGLTIKNYTNVCINWGADGWGQYWTIEDNDVSLCSTGIVVKKGGTYRGNYVHHNERYGMEGTGEFDLLIEGNEIAYNRTDLGADPGDSGATKFLNTADAVFRGNNVHDNYGQGIWFDGYNYRALIEDNTVTDNNENGILYELGYTATIRNNVVTGNGFSNSGGGGEGAGILVIVARDCEVYGNTVAGNRNGIGGQSADRGTDRNTGLPWRLAGLYVHDNTVTMNEADLAKTGIWDFAVGQPAVQASAGNRFENNTYSLTPTGGLFFKYGNPTLTLAGWQAIFPLDG